MKQRYSTIMIVIVLSFLSCNSNTNFSENEKKDNHIDSLVICYHKENNGEGGVFLEERSGLRKVFMQEDANAMIRIKDSTDIEMLKKLIGELRPRKKKDIYETVLTCCVLLVYKDSGIDTLAIAEVPPPRVQVKDDKYIDSICDDSLLCKTVWDLIARNDSIWLVNCNDGWLYSKFWADYKIAE